MGPHFFYFFIPLPPVIDDHFLKNTNHIWQNKVINPVVERWPVWLKNACIIKMSSRLHKGGDDQVEINRKNCQRGNLH